MNSPTQTALERKSYKGYPNNELPEVKLTRQVRGIVRKHGVESKEFEQEVATLFAAAMQPHAVDAECKCNCKNCDKSK